MRAKETKLYSVIFLSLFIFFGCKDTLIDSPPDFSVDQLLSAPDTLVSGSKKLTITTEMWRDFMPISPPEGKPLVAIVNIETIDSTGIPSSLSAKAIYIVNNSLIWKSFFGTEGIPAFELKPYRIRKMARNGPIWGPGIFVDVVVLVKDNGVNKLLKAPHQSIGRTD